MPTPLRTWFVEVAPGLTVFHESPRALHQITYTHPMAVYFADNSLDASSDVVTWQGLFVLSPRDELMLGAGVTRSRINAGVLRSAVGQGSTAVVPQGDASAVTVTANEAYTHDFSPRWHGLQNSAVSASTRVGRGPDEPNHYLVDAGLGGEYTVGNDGFALLGHGSWFFTPADTQDGVETAPREDQLILGADIRWRRDWTPRWSTSTSVGAAASVDPQDVRHILWSPIWSAGLFYFVEGPSASLIYSRSVAPNVLTGQNYLTDQLTLTGGLPLSESVPLVLGSSLAAAQSRAIDATTQTLQGRVRSLMGDASLGYFSQGGLAASIRYQHYRQYGDDTDLQPVPTFHRNVVQLTIGGMFPARELPEVPGRRPVRVDGGDRTIMQGASGERPRTREDDR